MTSPTPASSSSSSSASGSADGPGSPSSVVVPGVVLVFAGLWMVTDPGGPLGIGWACFAVGLALLLVGVVAAGVAWGLHLDELRRRRG